MRRHAIIGALLLIGVGVILGATVFRTDIAQATGLAQSVTVTNTPLPVREQNLDGGSIKVHEQGTVAVRSANDELSFSAEVPGDGVCERSIYTVPAGKQLVVEWIGGTADSSGATGASAAIVGDLRVLHFVFQEQKGVGLAGTSTIFVASQPVHFVFPAGASLGFQGTIAGSPTSCHFFVSVGGYLQPT